VKEVSADRHQCTRRRFPGLRGSDVDELALPPLPHSIALVSWAVRGVDHPSPRGGKRQAGSDMMNRIRRMGFYYIQHRLPFILCILFILSQSPSL
jgi:hypothetical protein